MAKIEYAFVASGVDSVTRGFDTIGAAAQRNKKVVENSYAGQTGAARKAADVQVREARRPASRLEQLARQVERDQIRSEARQAREKERAERAAVLNRQRSLDHVARIRERHQSQELRKEKAHQDQVLRIYDGNVKRRISVAEQAARKQAQTEIQFAERVANERRQKLGRIGGELKGLALGGAAGAMALGAGVAGAAIGQSLDLQKTANRISINARQHGENFIDPSTLRREFEATAIGSGGTVKAAEVADAVQRFISLTGNVKMARRLQGSFATAATASGANIGDIAETVASTSQQFGISSEEDTQKMLALLTAQGKSGAFEIKDAAAQYQRLAASAGAFNVGKGVDAVRRLGGLTQVARSGTGSAEQASTAVENLFTNLKVKAADFENKDKVKIYSRNKRGDITGTRNIEDIITDMIVNVGGTNIKKKNALLAQRLGEQGIRAVNPLINTFTSTFQNTKGTEAERKAAARSAVAAQLNGAINAPGDWHDIERDAAQAKNDPGAKLEAAWSRLTASIADKALPVIERMADKFELSEGFIEGFVGTLEALLDMIEGFALTFGIIKSNDPERQRRKNKSRAKEIDEELEGLPTLEKVAALGAQGKVNEAKAMLAEYNATGNAERVRGLMAERAALQKGFESDDATRAQERDFQKTRTKDQFADLYASLAGGGDKEYAARQAADVARRVSSLPSDSYFGGEGALVGENEAQRKARLAFAQTTKEARAAAGGKADESGADIAGKGLAAMFERISKSADKAAGSLAKLDAITQPSIIKN